MAQARIRDTEPAGRYRAYREIQSLLGGTEPDRQAALMRRHRFRRAELAAHNFQRKRLTGADISSL